MSGSRVYPRAQPNEAGQGRVSVDSFFRVPQVARSSQPHLTDRPFPVPSWGAPKPTDQQHPERLQRDVREQGHLSERTYQNQRQNLNVKKQSYRAKECANLVTEPTRDTLQYACYLCDPSAKPERDTT